jgi:hypothetical protein
MTPDQGLQVSIAVSKKPHATNQIGYVTSHDLSPAVPIPFPIGHRIGPARIIAIAKFDDW